MTAREALREIVLASYWVDSHPGKPCKKLLNPVPLSQWKRWHDAALATTDDEETR